MVHGIRYAMVMRCYGIRYHLYKSKNVKNTHRGVLPLVTLQASAYNFAKTNTPPWVFFHLFKIVQMVPNRAKRHICVARFSTMYTI